MTRRPTDDLDLTALPDEEFEDLAGRVQVEQTRRQTLAATASPRRSRQHRLPTVAQATRSA